jgi:hypothetical protein
LGVCHWRFPWYCHLFILLSRCLGNTFLHSHGERIELQVHSAESIDVKERTTPLYEIERDRRQDPAARDAARRECIVLSDQLTQPAGIDELRELGGATVQAISYGKQRQAHRTEAVQPDNAAAGSAPERTRQPTQNRQNGVAR